MLYSIISCTEDAKFKGLAYFEFYSKNGGTGDFLCRVRVAAVQATKDTMTDKNFRLKQITGKWNCDEEYSVDMWSSGSSYCKNDEAESMVLCNGKKNTKITVFDDGEFNKHRTDDWAIILVKKSFVGCVTIPTFEKSQHVGDDQQVYVGYATDGNLDAKVSSFKIRFIDRDNRDTLEIGEELESGDELVSPNEEYSLRMQNDRNLVVYKRNLADGDLGRKALWASDTHGQYDGMKFRLVLQKNNNLVVLGFNRTVIWSSSVYFTWANNRQWAWMGPKGAFGFASMQDDGNFVVRDGKWNVMWESKTAGGQQGMYGTGRRHLPYCHENCNNLDLGCNKCKEVCAIKTLKGDKGEHFNVCSYDKQAVCYHYDCRACHYDD